MTETLDRRRSVTSGDFIEASPQTTGGGVWYWSVYDPGSLTSPAPELPRRSVSTWTADQVLSATLDLEDMWAGAINQAVTKIAVRGWEISDSDDSTRRTRKGHGTPYAPPMSSSLPICPLLVRTSTASGGHLRSGHSRRL
jgi:hypothetical protein